MSMVTIAVTGGKGGVGKTTFSANLSAALAMSGKRTVVFDADLQLANLDIVLGVSPEFNLQHVVAGKKKLKDVMCPGPGGLKAITGGSAVPLLMRSGPKRMATFLSQISDLDRTTDYLVFDTSAGLDNKVLTFLKLAQEIVLVVSPDPTSITDAYATVKTLFRRDPNAVVHVVFNMAGDGESYKLFQTFEKVVWTYLGKRVQFLGNVRFDHQAAICNRRRQLFVVEYPGCKAAQDIVEIAKKISDRSHCLPAAS